MRLSEEFVWPVKWEMIKVGAEGCRRYLEGLEKISNASCFWAQTSFFNSFPLEVMLSLFKFLQLWTPFPRR